MPRTGWLSGHSSGTHLSALNRTSSSSSISGSHSPSSSSHGHPSNHRASPSLNPALVPIPPTPFEHSHSHDPSTPSGYFPPSSGISSPSGDGAHTPYHDIRSVHGPSWIEISLDSENVVLRGAGGDTNPASLSGRVILHLAEATNMKEITLTLTGKAKIGFADGQGSATRSHHHTHLVLHYDWSFLSNPGGQAGAKKSTSHVHTLKAGSHSFPFQYTIESDSTIPSSLRTWNNDAHVFYKLRAVGHRSGAFSTNFQATKPVNILRTFTAEALEFTQTLEIENTWPLKVAYSLTLPHKAFAAGDNIPIAVKFQPLSKGVHITQISTVVKEYTLVHTRSSSHPDVRVAAAIKHDIRDGRAYVHKDKPAASARPAPPPIHDDSPSSTPYGSHGTTPGARMASGLASSSSGGSYFPQQSSSNPTAADAAAALLGSFAGGVDPALASQPDAQEAYLVAREEAREVELGDGEIDTMISIPLPSWTTPSHAVHPVFVTHKIKWSCVISNPDGHTSELRCALPIHVLPVPLAEEARIASASTRAMLFGLSGDAQAEVQQLDLPSYSNHVYDRVANAAVGSASGATAAPWSRNGSPVSTPPGSRPGSRHGSPVLGTRALPNLGLPDDFGAPPERPHLNWADSELLLSLGASMNQLGESARTSKSNSPHATPPESRAPSRPSSRSGFRSSRSRPGSRASSPERERSTSTPFINGETGHPASEPSEASSSASSSRGHLPRVGSHGGGLFHLPMKPFTSLGGGKHHKSSNHLAESSHHSHPSSSAHSPIGSKNPSAEDLASLSQVPSYAVASRGFLGGGVVPISAVQGLPDYDESENFQRAKSEGNLLEMGRRASAGPSRLGAGQGGGQASGAGAGGPGAGASSGGNSGSGLEGTGLGSSASSSALATALSTLAEPGSLSQQDMPPPPPSPSSGTSSSFGHHHEDEDRYDDDDDDDTLQISTKKSRAKRSTSVSTVKPS